MATNAPWQAPADIDPECIPLCAALNAMRGIQTNSSCCGHSGQPFRVWFAPENLDALPQVLYWFDACHSGRFGWNIRTYTDCVGDYARFVIEGPDGAYEDANHIAELLTAARVTGQEGG